MYTANLNLAKVANIQGRQDTDSNIQGGYAQPAPAGTSVSSKEMNDVQTMDSTVAAIAVPKSESTWRTWIAKLLFTLISLKSWGIFVSIAITSWLVMHRSQTIQALVEKGVDPQLLEQINVGITGGQWMTFNITIWTMLYGIKEMRKVADNKQNEKV